MGEYLDTPRVHLNWIIHEQLPYPGTLLLQGPPKSGKSFLCLDLARNISQGTPVFRWATRKSSCLYLQFDTSEMIWRHRVEKQRSAGVSFDGSLYQVHPEDMRVPFNISNPQDYEWLRQVIRHADPEVTIIDVLREIHNADENDSTKMKIVGDKLMSIFKDRSLILVHHSKKIGEDVIDPSPVDVSRGSSYLTGKVDAIWFLWRHQLRIQSRNSEAQFLRLRQDAVGVWLDRENTSVPSSPSINSSSLDSRH